MARPIGWGERNHIMFSRIRNKRRKVVADKSRKINRRRMRLIKKGK